MLHKGLDMFPRFITSHIRNSGFSNSIQSGKISYYPMIFRILFNSYNLIFSKMSIGGKRTLETSTFINHVHRVNFMGTYKEMFNIYARRVITGVTYNITRWNVPIFNGVKISTYLNHFSMKLHNWIASTIRSMRCTYIATIEVFTEFYRPTLSFSHFIFCYFRELITLMHTFSKQKIPGEGRVCEKMPCFNDRINRVRFYNGVFADSINNIIHGKRRLSWDIHLA